MVLFGRRQRLKALAQREAAGENFWTTKFDSPVRMKIRYAFDDCVDISRDGPDIARALILRDEGLGYLHDQYMNAYPDLMNYLLTCDDTDVPSIVEALAIGIARATYANYEAPGRYTARVSQVLREHRISFDFVNGEMIPFSSLEMHTSVIEPALRLLSRTDRFSKVESAYQAALKEISNSNSANAITDAGTALQEMLTELGCEGNALGPLIKSAKNKKILAPHDGPMLDAIDRLANWVSADRSERGDAHKVASPTISDAWFTVHVVGAVIIRLADESSR